jgi:hypothetical protein
VLRCSLSWSSNAAHNIQTTSKREKELFCVIIPFVVAATYRLSSTFCQLFCFSFFFLFAASLPCAQRTHASANQTGCSWWKQNKKQSTRQYRKKKKQRGSFEQLSLLLLVFRFARHTPLSNSERNPLLTEGEKKKRKKRVQQLS